MNTKLIFKGLLAVVIVGLLGVAVWKGSTEPQTAAILPSASESPSVSATPKPTAPVIAYGDTEKNWQKYSSSSLGFQVSYPADWVKKSCGENCVAWAHSSSPEDLVIGISVSEGTLDEVKQRAEPYEIGSQSIGFGRINWLRLTLLQPQTNNIFTSHFAVSGKKLYEFGVNTAASTSLDVYGRMVKSFTFLSK